jgi:hypothetical protein
MVKNLNNPLPTFLSLEGRGHIFLAIYCLENIGEGEMSGA